MTTTRTRTWTPCTGTTRSSPSSTRSTTSISGYSTWPVSRPGKRSAPLVTKSLNAVTARIRPDIRYPGLPGSGPSNLNRLSGNWTLQFRPDWFPSDLISLNCPFLLNPNPTGRWPVLLASRIFLNGYLFKPDGLKSLTFVRMFSYHYSTTHSEFLNIKPGSEQKKIDLKTNR